MSTRALAIALALASLIGLCGFDLAGAEVAEEPLSMDDFAYGRTLSASPIEGLKSVLLDFEVYERSIVPGLADLRVFDARGRPVPYALRRRLPNPGSRTKGQYRSLPLFRLEASPSAEPSGDYRIDAKLSASGAIVSVIRGDGSPVEANDNPEAWLVDVSGLKRSIVGIEFDFDEGIEDFVSRVHIEKSNDLARWTSVRSDIVVAWLEQAGHRIERFRFSLPATSSRYLRLTPIGTQDLPTLRHVRLQPSDVKQGSLLPKEVKTISGRIDPESPQSVLFDLAGAPSVESVRVVLPVSGSVVEGRVESSENVDGPWTHRASELFYHYEQNGLPVKNDKIDWSGRRHRYVRLVASNRGGGLQGQTPGIEIEWVPDQLLYLDRGDGVSTLAVGRIETTDASFTPAQLLLTLRGQGENLREATAVLGDERLLAGERALIPPPPPVPWRTYFLWALLIGIVAVVLGLGFRLLRSSEAEDP